MANKKTNEKVDATQMSDEQLKKLHDKFRKDLREKFGKWLNVYDEEATKEDVDKAKAEFDKEVAKYANKTYVIMDHDALAFAKLLKNWNATLNHWEKGTWKGMLMFDKVISEAIEKYKADATLPFEVDYATLMYLYQTMSNPAGVGLESAKAMAELEGFDIEKVEKKDDENFVTYSHILQNVLEIIRQLSNIDKKLKLMRERINIATAGIKFDFKITELEEFIELHDAFIGEAVPNDEELQKM
jgi:hypothetical protein